ncbi:MAG: SpoIIE family protein phosphatase [Anaerolineae bacterium]|nr:SpoIIE family protein phosphatase [Phycisphaerae bacterium]
MRLGTKILLLMLLITIGTSAVLAWLVTFNVTRYETRRANEKISQAIGRYMSHLEDRHRQVERITRALLEAPAPRSQLQAADESNDPAAREQLKQEILGRTAQIELTTREEGAPAFHVLVNPAHQAFVTVAHEDPMLEGLLGSGPIHWPVDAILHSRDRLISHYISTPAGLFLAMGVPLRTQLDESPTHAYFVGFRIDNEWVRRQLVELQQLQTAARTTESGDAPLSAWFVVGHKIVAKASSDPSDARMDMFTPQTPITRRGRGMLPASRSLTSYESIEFDSGGERYLGQSFDLRPTEAEGGQLILASSLDHALAPLRTLQKQIVLCTLIACGVAVLACQWIARRIARPIQQLVDGTQRIAAGQFDQPVDAQRGDELGKLAKAFNEMSAGLKERDVLRDERTKVQRDLALARKIQMDVLPKIVPPCVGYDVAAYSLPAEQTGGDIYDLVALTLEDGEAMNGQPPIVMLLADAAGHGVGPALSVTQVRAMLRIGVRLRAHLGEVLEQINRQLCQDLGAERFVTAFLGLLDPNTHIVTYQSAGQAPLLHFSAREEDFKWLGSSQIPLGIDEQPDSMGTQQITLEPGDLVVLLTDGFYEYPNTAGEQFSTQRVADVIRTNYGKPAKEILAELLIATRTFAEGAPQMDDMTALIIKRQPATLNNN